MTWKESTTLCKHEDTLAHSDVTIEMYMIRKVAVVSGVSVLAFACNA
jgi:hypothetical protein